MGFPLKKYPREAVMFIIASFINAMGSAFMWPLITLYVHNVLGRSFGEAGLVLLLQSLAGIGGQILGGALFYRLGAKNLIVGSLVVAAGAQFTIIFSTNWPFYISMMMTLGFLNLITRPVINAFIGFRWQENRKELFNVVYVGNNIGIAIGTTIGGLLAVISFKLTFLINGITTLCFAIFFLVLMKKSSEEHIHQISMAKPKHQSGLTTKELLWNYKIYLFLGIGGMFIWFSNSLWGSGIAPYLNDQGLSVAYYSFLWTVNGIVIFIGQPFTTLIKNWWAKSLPDQIFVSALFYTFSFSFILIFHHGYVFFIICMILGTFGEMLIAPAVPAYITEFTGTSSPFYLGVVGAFDSIGRLLGPFIFGSMYDIWGKTPIFVLAVITSALAALFFFIHATNFRYKTTLEIFKKRRII